mmetsp:Transcript_18816/g.55768  ORF Transcript_18816/g.55768 Transcript_18816/m.55768 type:complete len:452 (-) Transcript_18816:1041-2396(-)
MADVKSVSLHAGEAVGARASARRSNGSPTPSVVRRVGTTMVTFLPPKTVGGIAAAGSGCPKIWVNWSSTAVIAPYRLWPSMFIYVPRVPTSAKDICSAVIIAVALLMRPIRDLSSVAFAAAVGPALAAASALLKPSHAHSVSAMPRMYSKCARQKSNRAALTAPLTCGAMASSLSTKSKVDVGLHPGLIWPGPPLHPTTSGMANESTDSKTAATSFATLLPNEAAAQSDQNCCDVRVGFQLFCSIAAIWGPVSLVRQWIPSRPLQPYFLASSICSSVRFTHSCGAVRSGSSSIHGIAHFGWRVICWYAGSTGECPVFRSMEVMASQLVGSVLSKIERSGSGPTTHPLVAILSPGLMASRLAIALLRSATASVKTGFCEFILPHSHPSGVHTQYHVSVGILALSRVKIPSYTGRDDGGAGGPGAGPPVQLTANTATAHSPPHISLGFPGHSI